MKYTWPILVGVASVMLACSVNVSAGAGAPQGEEAEQATARPDMEATDPDPAAESPETEADDASPATQMKEVAEVDAPPRKKACTTSEECGDGMVCEGEGCGEGQGICFSKDRMCTRDLQTYCGCDGVEFQSSGSCPGQRYSARGACPDAPT